MSQWNSSKSFREDYEKRISQSLDMRQLSKDGRMRNPEEKPLVSQEISVETEVMMKLKEEPPSLQQNVEIGKDRKNQQEAKEASKEEDEVFGLEKKPIKKIEVVDVGKVREIEMEKAKHALERKKKLAEKAAAKAKIKAEKEAEKKLKEIITLVSFFIFIFFPHQSNLYMTFLCDSDRSVRRKLRRNCRLLLHLLLLFLRPRKQPWRQK